jgi:hypothetical protein
VSDELLRQLIAAGQTDVLVGIPTLNNAATIEPVLAAVHEAIDQGPPHHRVLIINSDGGSEDDTPRIVSQASRSGTATLLASHSLRTMHRIAAPFHGLPGKRAAVRTLVAAADLLQVRAVAIVDPANTAPSADTLKAHLREVLQGSADFVADAPVRDPREGPLVTQVVRPLIAGILGASFEDPLGEQFTASGRFAADVIRQPAWDDEPLRAGIDVWLRVHALAGSFRNVEVASARRPRSPAASSQPLRTVVQQVLVAIWACLDRYAARWTSGAPVEPPARIRRDGSPPPRPSWDVAEMEQSFRSAARDLDPLWRTILTPPVLERVRQAAGASPPGLGEDLWADVLVEFTEAWKSRRVRDEELAASFAPIYLGRAAGFLRGSADADPASIRADLASLERGIRDRKSRLAEAWRRSGHGGSS